MANCEWCGREVSKPHIVMTLGNKYKVCDICNEAHEDETCIKCNGPIIGQGSLMGLCHSCAQEIYHEQQLKKEEEANGVALDLLEAFDNGVEFTEKDYEEWVTFGQGDITPAYVKRCRQNWLRIKLVAQHGWSADLVEEHLECLEFLMDKYISKIIDNKYILVYYDGTNRKQKIREFIDKIGNIYLVEKRLK